MPDIERRASATWTGDLQKGSGTASVPSGALKDVKISVGSRFGNETGSNPEELIAAAHASCFSMQLSALLSQEGHPPQTIRTNVTLSMRPVAGGFQIFKIHLDTEGKVPGIDETAFRAAAEKAKEICPVSGLLKPGLEALTLNAKLVS